MRQTRQRQAILRLIQAADDHPTAAQVYERARQVLPELGFATVYRSLRALAGEGLIREVRVGEVAQYDRRTDRHDHVVCRRCGRLADVVVPLAEAALAQAAAESGFQIEAHHTELSGLCPYCA
jgi:Fur family ferric uptake transcriptional regulator/Fur family peroxide stress response transcriptional regulator